jgi:superfamily II DNA or RNA helicase
MNIEDLFPIYPTNNDKDYNEKIFYMKEYHEVLVEKEKFGNGLYNYQELARRLMSPHTPYNRLILNFAPGTGKTKTAISIIKEYAELQGQKTAIFLMESSANENVVINEYKQEFGLDLSYTTDSGQKISTTKKMKHVRIMTYKELSNKIDKVLKGERTKESFIEEYSNRVIIYDEVHNLKVENLNLQGTNKWENLLNEKIKEEDKDEDLEKKSKSYKKTFNNIKTFSSILEDTGNVHIGLTATITVNMPEEMASIVELLFPNSNIDSKIIRNIYDIKSEKELAKKIYKKYEEYFNNIDIKKVFKAIEFRNKLDNEIEDLREMAVNDRKNVNIEELVLKKVKYDKYLNKVVKRGLENYLIPIINGRILKVSKISNGPKEILMGDKYNIRGVDLDIYPVVMEEYQSNKYIENERENIEEGGKKGKGFKTLILKELVFTYPYVRDYGDNNIELTLDETEDEEYNLRKAKQDDILEEAENAILTPAAKRFFTNENIKECSIIFDNILKIIQESNNEQIYIKLTYLDNIKILTALIIFKLNFQQFLGKGKSRAEGGNTGMIKPPPTNLVKQYEDTTDKDEKNKLAKKLAKYTLPAKRIGLITGKVSDSAKNNIVDSFNLPENKEGEFLKIIIGSRASSESINFPNARVLIRIPEWNPAKNIQVRGRVFRVNSQLLFPPNNRYVKVYNIAPVLDGFFEQPNIYATAYTLMYAVSKQKAIDMDIIENIIENSSLTKYINTNIQKLPDSQLNMSSYITYYRTNIIKDIKNLVLTYFISNSSFKLNDFLNSFKVEKTLLYLALNEMQSNHEFVYDRFGRKCFIKNFGDLYYTQTNYADNIKTQFDAYYSDKLFVKNGESEISIIVNRYKDFSINFLKSYTDKQKFICDFLELDVTQKISVFENSFFIDFDQLIKDTLLHITRNLWFIFNDDSIIVHIMAKGMNINYKANTKRIKSNDQIMRGLKYSDKNAKWIDVNISDSNTYTNTISLKLEENTQKYQNENIYGTMSVIDGKFRLCDNRNQTKNRKDGNTDMRTCKRGIICSDDNFMEIFPYIVELNLLPPYDNKISSLNKLERAKTILLSKNLNLPSDSFILKWLHPNNKKDSSYLLYNYLDSNNLVEYK